jgi:hypothetical protein
MFASLVRLTCFAALVTLCCWLAAGQNCKLSVKSSTSLMTCSTLVAHRGCLPAEWTLTSERLLLLLICLAIACGLAAWVTKGLSLVPATYFLWIAGHFEQARPMLFPTSQLNAGCIWSFMQSGFIVLLVCLLCVVLCRWVDRSKLDDVKFAPPVAKA